MKGGGDATVRQEVHSGVRVWCVGTGSPRLDGNRMGSSVAFETEQGVMLVDCGVGTVSRLTQLGLRVGDIHTILLTHHHIDHNADVPSVAVLRWVANGKNGGPRLRVIGPTGTRDFVERALSSLEQDIVARGKHGLSEEAVIPEVVEVQEDAFSVGDFKVSSYEVDHRPIPYALGYVVERDGVRIGISGDTRPCEATVEKAEGVDVLIHEALYPGYGIPSYHTTASDAGEIAARAHAKRLVLTHLIPGTLEDSVWIEAASAHYPGPIVVAQDLLEVARWSSPGEDPGNGVACWNGL